MTSVKATVKDRRLELEVPDDWPDGIQVEIHPLSEQPAANSDVMSAEEITSTLAAMDRIEPFDLTDAELLKMESEWQATRERDKADFGNRAEELRRMWE